MTNMDLMLLITSFIFAPVVPKIDQSTFNKLVKEATEYEYSLESVWRLAMNYDYKNLDYDLIDRYFVNCKNCYYLGEYISGVAQVDTSKICSLIIESKDKGFIKEILKNELILDYLNEEDINRLNNYLIEN